MKDKATESARRLGEMKHAILVISILTLAAVVFSACGQKGTTTGEIQENQLKDVHEVYLAIKKHYENNI